VKVISSLPEQHLVVVDYEGNILKRNGAPSIPDFPELNSAGIFKQPMGARNRVGIGM
jgi:hypothetical protein